jgi:hypothetical protein
MRLLEGPNLNLARSRGWNTYGLGDKTTGDHPENTFQCSIHAGTQLIKDPKDQDTLICPSCGLSYQPSELTKITSPTSKFGTNKGPMLLQPDKKKKKVLRAEDGSEINKEDTQIIQDLSHGLRVLSYNEWKPDKVDKK